MEIQLQTAELDCMQPIANSHFNIIDKSYTGHLKGWVGFEWGEVKSVEFFTVSTVISMTFVEIFKLPPVENKFLSYILQRSAPSIL